MCCEVVRSWRAVREQNDCLCGRDLTADTPGAGCQVITCSCHSFVHVRLTTAIMWNSIYVKKALNLLAIKVIFERCLLNDVLVVRVYSNSRRIPHFRVIVYGFDEFPNQVKDVRPIVVSYTAAFVNQYDEIKLTMTCVSSKKSVRLLRQ